MSAAAASSLRTLLGVAFGVVVGFYVGQPHKTDFNGSFPPHHSAAHAPFPTADPVTPPGHTPTRNDHHPTASISHHLHRPLSASTSTAGQRELSKTLVGETNAPVLNHHAVQEAQERAASPPCMAAAALGLPSDQAVRCYGGYIASLNYERRIPNWVVEVLQYSRLRPSDVSASSSRENCTSHAKPLKNKTKREGENQEVKVLVQEEEEEAEVEAHHSISRQNSTFFADPTVDDVFRVLPRVYSESGYWGISRGHLAPAQFHKSSQEEMNATFNMNANIVPQDMALNALDWFRLEVLTMRIAKALQYGTQEKKKVGVKTYVDPDAKLYVATGPAFVPTRNKDGQLQVVYDVLESKRPEQMVAVPTHLYKVLVAERREKETSSPQYSAAAFLLPNHAIAEEKPLSEYQVPIASLESLTGLRFFPAINAATLPNLCNRYRCDAKGSALFNSKYRPIAQLRTASSVPELRQRFHKIMEEHAKGKGAKSPMDSSIEKEYKKRLEVLLSKSVQSVD